MDISDATIAFVLGWIMGWLVLLAGWVAINLGDN